MGKPLTLMQDVMAEPPPPSFWFSLLPAEFQAEMVDVRAAFIGGTLPTKRYKLASKIIAHAKGRGLRMPSQKVVAEWLRNDG